MTQVTIFTVLFKSDEFIDYFIQGIENLEQFSIHELIISFYKDFNSTESFDKILYFTKNRKNIKLLLKTANDNNGLYADWNAMLNLAETDLVMNLNPDDLLHPKFLMEYLNIFENDPSIDLLFCPVKVSETKNQTNFDLPLPTFYHGQKVFLRKKDIYPDINFNYEYKINVLKDVFNDNIETKSKWLSISEPDVFDFFMNETNDILNIEKYRDFNFVGSCPMWKKSLFIKYGGFDENTYGISADWELWLRFLSKGAKFKKIETPLVIYYKNPNSLGHCKRCSNSLQKIMKQYHPIFSILPKNNIAVIYSKLDQHVSNLGLFFDNELIKCSHEVNSMLNVAQKINKDIVFVHPENKNYPTIHKNQHARFLMVEKSFLRIDRNIIQDNSLMVLLLNYFMNATQSAIQYLLCLFFENREQFIFKETEIYWRDLNYLFFKGVINNNEPVQGKLFNWMTDKILYDGKFKNGLPYGQAKDNSLWLNGFPFGDQLALLGKFYQMNLNNEHDYWIFKNFKGMDYSIIHFSNRYRFNPIIYSQIEIENCCDSIEKIQKGNHVLYYLDKEWQTPVITEKNVFDIIFQQESIPFNYFAFPWARLIDQMVFKKSRLLSILENLIIEPSTTVCQHIFFRELLPIYQRIGITCVFVSHRIQSDDFLEKKYGIKIHPFWIYPVFASLDQLNLENPKNKKYICSFKGNYNTSYLTPVRNQMSSLSKFKDCYIELNKKWYFYDDVYNNQLYNKNVEIIDENQDKIVYLDLLKNSVFSLCPSGTGPNSIRFWESLSYYCIPILLSNHLILPKIQENWEDCCVFWNENESDFDNLYNHLKTIPEDIIIKKAIMGRKIYEKYIKENNFIKIIITK